MWTKFILPQVFPSLFFPSLYIPSYSLWLEHFNCILEGKLEDRLISCSYPLHLSFAELGVMRNYAHEHRKLPTPIPPLIWLQANEIPATSIATYYCYLLPVLGLIIMPTGR
jgi:hypothetical protein